MDTALHDQLARLVVKSGDGNITEKDLAAAGGSLKALAYSSLSFMRLIDAIENELGVYIDPEAAVSRFETVAGIADLVRESQDD
ncbi:phosphopantetheine-binding protein [Actinophytocola glycyrrhizae]|uniref:Phosphopantetheine-binding protein n=1 Tax=Actinophytocola glycyrrhizae TaxID=2044873 RepID=A0ABV9S9K9_9PSEU